MVGVMSNSSALSREFVKIEIDGKVIKGNSKVENSGDYFVLRHFTLFQELTVLFLI